jgi:hypothetical protein
LTAVHVEVVRVFTDPDGRFGNPLGVIDGAAVPSAERHRVAAELGFSETVYVDDAASYASGHTFLWSWIDEPAGTIRARAFARPWASRKTKPPAPP